MIGVYPDRRTILIDAGALALSKDLGATHVHGKQRFGLICDLHQKPIAGVMLVGLSQEHGKIFCTEDFNGPMYDRR